MNKSSEVGQLVLIIRQPKQSLERFNDDGTIFAYFQNILYSWFSDLNVPHLFGLTTTNTCFLRTFVTS